VPDPPRHAIISEPDPGLLGQPAARWALVTLSAAGIVAGLTIIAVCLRIIWAVWPR
jgi:hypothetical protein